MHRLRRFRARVLIWFLLIVMLPMMTLSIYLYDGIVNATKSRLALQLSANGEKWFAGYQERVAYIQTLANMISNNTRITSYLSMRSSDDRRLIKDVLYSFRPMLEWVMATNGNLVRIHIFTENELLPEDRFVSRAERYNDEDWYDGMVHETDRGRMMPASPIRALPYDATEMDISVCSYQTRIISSPPSYLQLDVAADWLYDDIPLVIEESTGRVLYSEVDTILIGQQIPLDDLNRSCDGLHSVEISGVTWYPSICARDGELYISLLPADEVATQLRSPLQSYVIFSAVLAILMVCMAGLLTWHVTRRVETIGFMVNKIVHGEYNVSYTSRYDDEIDHLGLDVQEMGREMDHLVNQRLRQALLTREAEFRALQAQINPHFIFNTLESFQMIAELNGLKELSDMMALLGQLMRYNLGSTPEVTLAAELENVSDYIAVQNLNLNDRIRLETKMEKSLAETNVLRLMLQPIVENAIVHGMPRTGLLRIVISAERTPNSMRLHVANDGRTMTQEEKIRLEGFLEEGRSQQVSQGSNGIALQNIQRRLMLQYGTDCQLRLHPGEGESFALEWDIPIERRK